MSKDLGQLALDGMAETLFEVAEVSAVEECVPAPRVIDDDGREHCPACGSELKRARCGRCEKIGARALRLVR